MKVYQRALGKVLDGVTTMQTIDKKRNLDAFRARQQRIKARTNDAQSSQYCRHCLSRCGRHLTGQGDHV